MSDAVTPSLIPSPLSPATFYVLFTKSVTDRKSRIETASLTTLSPKTIEFNFGNYFYLMTAIAATVSVAHSTVARRRQS